MSGPAKLRISPKLLEQMLLPGIDAKIIDAAFDVYGNVELSIAGPDVPDAPKVRVLYTQTTEPDRPGVVITAVLETEL